VSQVQPLGDPAARRWQQTGAALQVELPRLACGAEYAVALRVRLT
jgi:hypothetical protein